MGKRFIFLAVLVLFALAMPHAAKAQCPPGAQGPGCNSSSGGGITPVSSLPATCTPGTSQPVQITGSITVGVPSISYGPGTVFYCDSTNHYSPVSQGSGASPILGFYFGPQCPPSNAALCFNTPANTQQAVDCAWSSGSPLITCNSAHFVAADVGKRAWGYQSCNAFTALM